MEKFKIWWQATRPKTLPAAVVPVLLASALASADGLFNPLAMVLCLFFAVFMQIGTNLANDYLDGIRGTDTPSRIGPQRAVATGQITAAVMRRAAFSTLFLGFCLGLTLIPFGGWWLLLIGVASVAAAWCYTGGPYPLAYNGLGDVFVVLFFGLIATTASYYVQTGVVSSEALLLGLGCGLLINNLLVVNNYRDMEEDTRAGKRTLVVLYGRSFARLQCRISIIIAASVLFFLSMRGAGFWILGGLLPIVAGLFLPSKLKQAKTPADYSRCLILSSRVIIAYGIFVALGILIA